MGKKHLSNHPFSAVLEKEKGGAGKLNEIENEFYGFELCLNCGNFNSIDFICHKYQTLPVGFFGRRKKCKHYCKPEEGRQCWLCKYCIERDAVEYSRPFCFKTGHSTHSERTCKDFERKEEGGKSE